MTRRVVVTGMGVVSPIGCDLASFTAGLRALDSGVRAMPHWGEYQGLVTRVGGSVQDPVPDYPRKRTRTMGRVGLLSLWATEQALAQAQLPSEVVQAGNLGISYGSTHGSSSAMLAALGPLLRERSFEGMTATSYLQYMSHTVAANLAIYFGVRGRVLASCSACTSGSQGIGFGYEAVKHGLAELMICGGAEELHEIHAAIFDVMYATSTRYNDAPSRTPRPYDRARDGMVVGEGAASLVIESLEHAQRRGAPILAEIIGYGTNCDGSHATSPSVDGMAAVMRRGLADAGLVASDVDWVNGHGTATELGDIAETTATAEVLGENVAISSTKSLLGHGLGACGAIESVACIVALQHGFLPGTRNLEEVDPRCAPLAYPKTTRAQALQVVMNNNFAFGGVNTCLLFAKT